MLESQLSAMTERLDSVYATATDLIADSDLDSVLARITERAATAVRAPRYLLALRTEEDSGIHCHSQRLRGGRGARAGAAAAGRRRVDELPSSWLVADVQLAPSLLRPPRGDGRTRASSRRSATCSSCTPATRPPRSTARPRSTEATPRPRGGARAARAGARAGRGDHERRGGRALVEAVPAVVDCDRVSVWVWDEDAARARPAGPPRDGDERPSLYDLRISPEDNAYLAALLARPEPRAALLRPRLGRRRRAGHARPLRRRVAMIVAPIVARGEFLGTLSVTVTSEPHAAAAAPRPARPPLRRGRPGRQRASDRAARGPGHPPGPPRRADRARQPGRLRASGWSTRWRWPSESGEPVGLFFVDLDDFKASTTSCGHHAGDELLCRVAERLLGTVRSADTVARLGGDEFAIVLSGVQDAREVEAAAERVLAPSTSRSRWAASRSSWRRAWAARSGPRTPPRSRR